MWREAGKTMMGEFDVRGRAAALNIFDTADDNRVDGRAVDIFDAAFMDRRAGVRAVDIFDSAVANRRAF